MALLKVFLSQTREILFRNLIQGYDLHHRLSDKLFASNSARDTAYFVKLCRIVDKAYLRSQRRYAAYKAFRLVEERELQAHLNTDDKTKIIRGWQHSNLFTLPSALISVTETGKSIMFPVGGLYSELSYKRKRMRALGKYLYTGNAPVLSKRYFPLPIKYQHNIIPG
jgi:hypothetical protein